MDTNSLISTIEFILRQLASLKGSGRTTNDMHFAASLPRRHDARVAGVDYVVLNQAQAHHLRRSMPYPGEVVTLEKAFRDCGGNRVSVFDHLIIENLLYEVREKFLRGEGTAATSAEVSSAKQSIRRLKRELQDLQDEFEVELENLEEQVISNK